MMPYRSYNRLLAAPGFHDKCEYLWMGDTQTGDEVGMGRSSLAFAAVVVLLLCLVAPRRRVLRR